MARKKNSRPKDNDPHQSVIAAALNLAAQQDWSRVTLREIAALSGLDLAPLRQSFASKDAILDRFAADIDAQLAATIDPDITSAPTRDRLFELLMTRFELLGDHKDALRSIMGSLAADPLGIVPGLLRLKTSMRWTLETAGISTAGLTGLLRVQFLCAAFLAALRAWLRDDSPDMATTMATIDRWINRADDLENRLCGHFGKQAASEKPDDQTAEGNAGG